MREKQTLNRIWWEIDFMIFEKYRHIIVFRLGGETIFSSFNFSDQRLTELFIYIFADSHENCNGSRTNNHLVRKRTLNHLAKLASLAKWLSVRLRTKWLWIRFSLQPLKLKI